MFTVKRVINNTTSIYETSSVNIGRPGSVQYEQAFEQADALGIDAPDMIEWIPQCYEGLC